MAASSPRKRTAPKPPAQVMPAPVAASGVDAFKKKMAGELVALPSGLAARMVRPGMHEFLKAGFLPDMLRPTVDKAIRRGQGLKPVEEKQLLEKAQTAEAIEEIARTYDLVTVRVWLEPRVLHHEREVLHQNNASTWEIIPAEERDDSMLYTDEIDFTDKAFTFNYAVGGTRDLQRFRQELAGHVEPLHGGEDVEVPSE